MSLKRNALAALAAGGLLISQGAAAAALPARSGAGVGASEDLAGTPPGAWVAIGPILLLLTIFGIMALTEDDNDFPESP